MEMNKRVRERIGIKGGETDRARKREREGEVWECKKEDRRDIERGIKRWR